jgi:HemY protein
MRAALWLLGLFGAAVAVALFAGNNQGTVTLFWPPYRVDFSLNMVVLLLVGGFVTLHAAFAGLNALLTLPRQAARWRQQQKERAMHAALLHALAHMLSGRFLRSRKAAQTALTQESALAASGASLAHARQLRALAHFIAADSSHALQDRATREEHLRQALEQAPANGNPQEQSIREGLQMRAARWTLDDRDSEGALERLAALPQGAARRTLALRIKLKASRLAGHTHSALDTARLLGKHHAFSSAAAQSSCSRSGWAWSPPSAPCRSWPSRQRSAWPNSAATTPRCAPGCCRPGSAWWNCPTPCPPPRRSSWCTRWRRGWHRSTPPGWHASKQPSKATRATRACRTWPAWRA